MYKKFPLRNNIEVDMIIRLSDNACIPFDPANTDYQAFKTYLSTPNASLQDAEGTAMTAQQIATFLETLP